MHIRKVIIILVLVIGLILLGFLLYRNTKQEPEQNTDETNETSESIEIEEPKIPDIWERPTGPESKEQADLEMELDTGKRNPAPKVIGGAVEYETKEASNGDGQ